MDKSKLIPIYIEAILPEQEAFLHQRALKKANAIMENMRPEDAEAYLKSKTFENLRQHIMRTDKVYQGLIHEELMLGQHQAEFDRLAPLIDEEIRKGRTIDLAFLRSVERNRVPLKKARTAVRYLEENIPGRILGRETQRFIKETERAIEQYYLNGNLTGLVMRDPRPEKVVPHLMDTLFRKGISSRQMDEALQGQPLMRMLRRELYHRYPELAACRQVRTPTGETVENRVTQSLQELQKRIYTEVRKRFPPGRIRNLLNRNSSLRALQAETDSQLRDEHALRSALLTAIPEHYRDLYPLARGMHRRFILHLGPTNSGKTHEGVARLHSARKGIYLGPLRLLAAEQFETLNLSGIPCSLVTGEEQIRVGGSRVQSSTVEMADLETHYDIAVIDECQMITDRDRGGAWTDAILGLCADEIHACASPDAEALLTHIILDCGDELTIVRHERMTPLVVEKEGFQFPASVRPGDALIVFSKARVHAVAAELKRLGFHVSLIYGALPPDVRRDQAERFLQGDNEVVVSTDAIAMGMNLPIERVVFLESEKYDGDIIRPLNNSEIKQIAGRAGRYGQYDIGYVNAYGFKGTIAQALSKPFYPLTEAIIRFPDSLLGIPLPLTQIINKWLAMKDKGCFSKASTVRMATLAAMLENKRTDKMLLYRFLCIPFDETETDLLGRWRAMYHAECMHEHIDVLAEIPAQVNPEECTIQMLDALEADYRCCDLYYNYSRLFLENPEPVLDEIGRRKSLISHGIIHILSTQKLKQRTCPECNTPLPWNWPYPLCEFCHKRHHSGKKRGYDGF